jgi:transcriptional regulator GlxA family with amidase domain
MRDAPFDPLSPRRNVAMVAFPGAQVLDITGPCEVLAQACLPNGDPAYAAQLVAHEAGLLSTTSGLKIEVSRSFLDLSPAERERIDTLLVAGGFGVEQAIRDRRLVAFIRQMAPKVRRLASICSGALLLAEAGLLDGRRATTHWGAMRLLRRYPRVRVEEDLLYVRDGKIWTSAGVTAGMDLTLALVREDLGHAAALRAAQFLVLFMMRPGGQAQFSAHLLAQTTDGGRLGGVPAWVLDHLDEKLPVARLAERAGMSERTFARVFHAELGMTAGRFVEMARIEAARRLLEESELPMKRIAWQVGFGDDETMRRAFHRHLRVSPADYQVRFRLPAERAFA